MQQDSRRRIVSTDAIRTKLFGDASIQGSWIAIWHEVASQFCQSVAQIDAGEVSEVIYDATNIVRKNRREAIVLAHDCGFNHLTGLWLNPSLATCLERNQQRDRQVPVNVILDMYRSLVGAPPSLAEGLDRLIEIKGKGLA